MRAATDYLEAIDRRDAARVCELLSPGTFRELRLPRERRDCAGSIGASLGYRDPRGLPVWESSDVADVHDVAIDGRVARVTVTVVTRFADRDEPSVEDDVVYLVREDGVWAVAKPSATLYRAIGAIDIPPDVISPP